MQNLNTSNYQDFFFFKRFHQYGFLQLKYFIKINVKCIKYFVWLELALLSNKYIGKSEGGICQALLLYSSFTELRHTRFMWISSVLSMPPNTLQYSPAAYKMMLLVLITLITMQICSSWTLWCYTTFGCNHK